jgi:hypothetical protein
MTKTIENLLKDFEQYHSRFQIENFILWESGNAWAQYKQALREIKSRKESLENYRDEHQLAQIDFKALKNKRAWFGSGKRKRREIELRRLARRIKNIEDTIRDVSRELSVILKVALRLKREKFDCLTNEQKRNLEAQAWFEKARLMAAVETMTLGQPSKATVELVLSMPKRMRKELLIAIAPANRNKLIAWAVGENAKTNRNFIKSGNCQGVDRRQIDR